MKSQHTPSSLSANILLPPPSTSLSALALFSLSLKKQGNQMRPTHQHLCPYAAPPLLVQWKDKLYKGHPLHLCTRSHPLSSTQIAQEILFCLSHHQISSVCWIFSIRGQTCQLFSSHSPLRHTKRLLARLLLPVIILFLSSLLQNSSKELFIFTFQIHQSHFS